jgi:hypothetical protein
MIYPARWLPVAPILQVNVIVVRCTTNKDLRNTAMQLFLLETNF